MTIYDLLYNMYNDTKINISIHTDNITLYNDNIFNYNDIPDDILFSDILRWSITINGIEIYITTKSACKYFNEAFYNHIENIEYDDAMEYRLFNKAYISKWMEQYNCSHLLLEKVIEYILDYYHSHIEEDYEEEDYYDED